MILFALLTFAVPAKAAPLPAFSVVKVESRFRAGSENKLEGSGLMYRHEGRVYVLTSEHVVIPSNSKTVHRIRNNFDVNLEATWVRSRWDLGLALLEVVTDKPDQFSELAPSLEELEVAENPSRVSAFGFPAGVTEFRFYSDGIPSGLHNAGAVLLGTPVTAIKNMMVEFGMSGGPALAAQGKVAGILTHITYEEDPVAFLIPAKEALAWAKNGDSGDFARDVKDFESQNFSKAKPEAVTHKKSEIRLEKRNGKFLVILNDQYSLDQGLDHYHGLSFLLGNMRLRSVRIAEVTNVPKDTTLAQFAAMFNLPVARSYRDYERGDNGSQSDIPSFFPKAGQQTVYDVIKNGRPGTRTIHVTGTYPAFELKETRQGSVKSHPMLFQGAGSSDLWRERRATCTDNAGALEEIEVPAGKFLTCHLRTPLLEFWQGPVPGNGIVKLRYRDGSQIEELRSVRYE